LFFYFFYFLEIFRNFFYFCKWIGSLRWRHGQDVGVCHLRFWPFLQTRPDWWG
jgi:hypothetical protein